MSHIIHIVPEEMQDEYDDRVIRPNKSQLRREALALLELGKRLADLDNAKLQKLDMPQDLYDALIESRNIHQNSARKRHFKHVGKLLRQINVEELESTIETIEQELNHINQDFHLMERWRDRLLDPESDAVTDFLNEYPAADSVQLRQLIRNAHSEVLKNKPPKSSRALFKLIRTTIEEYQSQGL